MKRLLIIRSWKPLTVVLVICAISTLLLAAIPNTETFVAADGTNLTTVNAGWSVNNGTFVVKTNAITGNQGVAGLAHWTTDTFSADQTVTVTFTSMTSGIGVEQVGPAVRVAASANTGYVVQAAGDASTLSRIVAGSVTAIDSCAGSYTAGDTCTLSVQGTTLTVKKNGTTLCTATDTNIATGQPGLYEIGTAQGQPHLYLGSKQCRWQPGTVSEDLLILRTQAM